MIQNALDSTNMDPLHKDKASKFFNYPSVIDEYLEMIVAGSPKEAHPTDHSIAYKYIADCIGKDIGQEWIEYKMNHPFDMSTPLESSKKGDGAIFLEKNNEADATVSFNNQSNFIHDSGIRPMPYVADPNPPFLSGDELEMKQGKQIGKRARGTKELETFKQFHNVNTLQMCDSLEEIITHWSPQEVFENRRLVHFFSTTKKGVIHVQLKAIDVSDRVNNGVIVSCIYHNHANSYFITSVDLLLLAELLLGTSFSVEQKNRIRRNLEGFKPMTVSKTSDINREFFKQIMNYNNPRPRNIEKDVKVFPWECISSALRKIIGRFETGERKRQKSNKTILRNLEHQVLGNKPLRVKPAANNFRAYDTPESYLNGSFAMFGYGNTPVSDVSNQFNNQQNLPNQVTSNLGNSQHQYFNLQSLNNPHQYTSNHNISEDLEAYANVMHNNTFGDIYQNCINLSELPSGSYKN